jgi:ParB/RepB/Spo0J family partition protein
MAVAALSSLVTGFYEIELSRLTPHPRNIRKELGDLTELAASIREKGVLEPLLVSSDCGYVVCGHRRLAAAELAELVRVPCVVSVIGDAEAIELMLTENLQRSGLTAFEEADAYQQLLDFGQTPAEIADNVSVNAERIRRRVALLQLPNSARNLLETHKITLGAAEELLQLKGHPAEIEQAIEGIDFEKRKEPLSEFGWRIDNAVQRIRVEEARAAAIAKASAEGLKVITEPKWDRRATQPIAIGAGYSQLPVKPKEHAKLACHAVFVDASGKLQPACTKPKNHPEATKKAETAERKPGRDYQAERELAEQRHASLVTLLHAYIEAHPAGSAEVHALAVMTLRNGGYQDSEATLCELLGIETSRRSASGAFADWLVQGATVIRGAMPVPEFARLQKARLAIDLAQLDESFTNDQGDDKDAIAWLLFLKGLGYEFDEEDTKIFDVDRVLAWSESPASAFAPFA